MLERLLTKGALFLVVVLALTSCAQGDPLPSALYTRDVNPGYDSMYSIGTNSLRYLGGYFDTLYASNITTSSNITGPIGPAGADGQGFTWHGPWDLTHAYSPYDVVAYGGSSFNCILAVTSATIPPLDAAHWAPMAQAGTLGAAGADGAAGPNFVSTNTGTNLTGVLVGDGTFVGVDASLIPVTYYATNLTVAIGTLTSGNYTSTFSHDGSYAAVTEVASTTGISCNVSFSGVTSITQVQFYGRYQGNPAHHVAVEIYNKDTVAFDAVATMVHSTTDMWFNENVFDGAHYLNAGVVTIRFRHVENGVAGHVLYLDYMVVKGNTAGTGGGVTDHGGLTGLADDDHTQYLRADGTRSLTGNMAVSAGITVDGVDISDHDARHKWGAADALNIKDLMTTPMYFFWSGESATRTTTTGGATGIAFPQPYVRTNATSGSTAGVISTNGLWFAVSGGTYNMRMQTRIEMGGTTDMMEAWIGFFASSSGYPTNASNHVAFKILSTGDSTPADLLCSNGAGATYEETDTTVNLAGWASIDLYITYYNNSVKYYTSSDGGSTWTLRATHTDSADIPNNVSLYLGAWVKNSEAVDKIYWIDCFRLLYGAE